MRSDRPASGRVSRRAAPLLVLLSSAAFAVAAFAVPVQGEAKAADGAAAPPSEVTWSRMVPLLSEHISARWDGEAHWVLVPPSPGEKASASRTEEAAVAALRSAQDDINWLGSGIVTRDMASPGRPDAMADALPASVLDALFGDPAFADPLRRFTAAALSGQGIACADCLSGLRPSRDTNWIEMRTYVGAFVHVESVDSSGRVDLRVGTVSSSLPPLDACDHDFAAAAYAVMRISAFDDAALRKAISKALNAEIPSMPDVSPDEVKKRLNEGLPLEVLTDPGAARALLTRLPDILDHHGLRCTDCGNWLRAIGR